MNEALKIIISAEIDNLKKNVEEAKGKVKSFKEQVKEAKQDVDESFAAAGESIKNGLKVGAAGMVAAGAALLTLSASTQEYRQNQAQLNAAFEQAALSSESAKGAYNELYKVIGDSDQAVESAANIAMLADSEAEVEKWSKLASGVLGTFHDTLQPEAFYEAANETLKLGEATGAFTQMLEQTGVMSVDEFNKKLSECNTEAEKQAFMLEVSNNAMGEAGEAYNKATEGIQAQREAQANLEASMATLGEKIEPILTALTTLASDVLTALTPYIQEFADNYLPVIRDVLAEVGDKLKVALDWLAEHKAILAVLAGIIAGVVAAIGLYNAVAAIKAAMDAAQVTTLGALITAQLASAAATIAALAPYLLIVAAIAAVIAIIVVCVKNWDTIKEKVKEVAEKIKNWVTDMKDKVVGKFTEIKTNITNKVNEIKSNITNKFNEIKQKITKPVEDAKNTVKNIIDKIKGFFKFEWSLPKLKVPKFTVSPAGWGVGDLLKGVIPKLSVGWFARGGVFDSPTLFPYGNGSVGGLGEAGAEAIVPLEKNTKWLEVIADKLAARQGNTPIVLEVDGKVFAQTSIKSINDLTRQTGSLQLKLV